MIRTVLLLLCLITTTAFAQQEICDNGLDDDFDGFIDCYDGSCKDSPACDGIFLGNDATCTSPPPSFPEFTMALDFSSPDETTNHLSRVAVGDLDRDGIPEIVTMNRYSKTLFILNGNDGSIKHQKTVSFEPYWELAIANIDDDACGEIYFIGYLNLSGSSNDGVYMYAYDCELNLLWRTVKKLPSDPINFGIADFDGDGQEEIYAKDEIYDAKTGTRIVKTTAPSYTKFNGGPVAVDIVGDERLELVAGLRIYQVNLGARTTDAGSLTLLQSRAEYFVRNEYNATSVADYDQDGFLDVLASGSTGSNGANTTVFFWDVENDDLETYNDFQPGLGSDYTTGWKNGTGRLNIADLDGDGLMNASFVSGRFLYALDENFDLLWRVTINEETSGHTGCTLFDFNGDGKAEIVYRDERYLYIIEGTDGSIYSQQACISRTNREYPIVADVDADGSTELCVTCGFDDTNSANNFNTLSYSRYSHVRVFKSAAEPWVPARRVWNQHGYFVVNVNDDLTIPTALQQHQLVFSSGSCTQGPNRPLNKFLNQSPYLNSEGCPTYAASDIAFHIEPTVEPPTCPDVNFQVSFAITNLGDVSVTGDIPVSFYTTNPLRPGAVKLNTVNITVTQLDQGDIVSVDTTVFGIGADSLYVVLNDAGTTMPTPIVLPNTSFYECDYDNIRGVKVVPFPVTLTANPEEDNEDCSTTGNGVARAFVPTGGIENTADYDFYWSNGTTAKSPAQADFVGPIYSGIIGGDYTVYARHKTANCNSDTVTVAIANTTTSFPTITLNVLSDQTSCSPLNGKLEAVIDGGSAGYTIEWYDNASDPLGISGPVASNLGAGSYLAVVSKGTCSATYSASIDGPAVPDAVATVLQHVVDCANPNSGTISADAELSGTILNPDDYTFTWYEYNNVTFTRGSILPAAHGTGPVRTGLPAGFYQVEILENASQCVSSIQPVVEVLNQPVVPDAPEIVIVNSQTSCDPLAPNGIMTANVFVGGVAQNPADFTFEWFKGQNTLPENLVTTVSDVNGKTVNQVSGGGTPYTVRVTNASNCSATADLAITEDIIAPVVTLTQLTPNTICDDSKATLGYNGSVQATVSFDGNNVALPNANYHFTWRDPSNNIIAVADDTNPVLAGLRDGNEYSVIVERTDLSCASLPDSEPVLKAVILPQLSTASTGSNNCDPLLAADGTATVTVTNNQPGDTYVYQWYSGNTVVAGNELDAAANNANQPTAVALGGPANAPNPYTVVVTNTATGCESVATQAVSDVSVVPVISFVSATPNTICSPASAFDGALVVQVDNMTGVIGDYLFTWYNGATNTAGNENNTSQSVQLDNLASGSYTVETTNTATGCSSLPVTNQVPDGRVFPAVAISSTGSNNCDATLTPDGTITASVTNGGANFSYQWTAVAPAAAISNAANNANQQTAINLGGPSNAPNGYQVLVTNLDNGCQSTQSGLVADLSKKPTVALQAFANTICNVFAGGPSAYNGHVDVTAVNHAMIGTSTLTYQWFNLNPVTNAVTGPNATSTTAILDELDNGKYGVRVTVDALGCTSDLVMAEVLDNLTPVTITTSVTPSTNCAPVAGNGIAEVTSPLGANFQYQWYDGTLIDATKIKAGKTNALLGTDIQGGVSSNFAVLVTDRSTGCRNNTSVNVADAKVIPTISLSVVQHNRICDVATIEPDGALLASVANAGANFSINWIGGVAPAVAAGVNGEQFTKLRAQAYSANVINNVTGCRSANDSESIFNNLTFPNPAMVVTPQTSCDASLPNGMLVASDNGVTASRTFNWFTGLGTGTPLATDGGDPIHQVDDLASGNYTVRVRIDATGCAATKSEFVPEIITIPQITFSATTPVTRCDTPDGSVTPSVTNASANFSISYVFTDEDGTPPSTSAAITASPTIVRTDLTPYAGLEPGFVSAVVVNNTTNCVSNPHTGQIVNLTDTYDIVIDATTPTAACGDPNGGVDISVTGGSGTYDYEWFDGTPTNTDINFFNNLPQFAGTARATSEDLGVFGSPVDNTVTTGIYTVVVTDQANGCGNYFISNVPFTNSPDVVLTTTPNRNCTTPDGSVAVVVTAGAGNVSGYSIVFYQGTSPDPGNINALQGEICFDGIDNDADGNDETADADCTAPMLNPTLSGVAQGDYFIQVIDNDVQNRPCPLGFHTRVLRDVKFPQITVDIINPNTSCLPATFADGEVQLSVNSAVGDVQPKDYYLFNISPLPLGFTLNAAPGNLIGNGDPGQNTGLIPGFMPQDYTFTIFDDVSNCTADVTATIHNRQDLPGSLDVTPSPETACAPGSNGSALATTAGGEAVTRFDFNWFQNSDATGSVTGGAVTGGGATTGELLNQSKVPVAADWSMGANGTGSGDRTFYVMAVRNATAPSGVGCPTGLAQVVIPDQHVVPDLTLTASFNSFCDAVNPGMIGDGVVTIVADADPSASGSQNSAGGFDYSWTNANPALTSPQLAQSNNFAIPQLSNGSYEVTATNADNGCIVIQSVDVEAAPYSLSIASATVIDQLICNPDGRIDVDQITIDRSAAGLANVVQNSALPLTSVYDFEWFAADPLDPNTMIATALEDSGPAVINAQSLVTGTGAGQYAAMGAGTYYVVATRKTGSGLAEGCATAPFMTTVNDNHVNPVVGLTSFSNTACLAGSGEGEIEVRVSDATDPSFGSFTFDYDWAAVIPDANGNDGDGVSTDGDADHVTGLEHGIYSLVVTNPTSGCFTTAETEVLKNETPVFVQEVDALPQISCDPNGDGSLNVVRITLNDRNGNTQTFDNGSNISDFEFDWTRDAISFTQTTAGTLLDVATYDGSAGGFGVPIGAGSYTVVARRVAGAVGEAGVGCASAPFQIDILDNRILPVAVLTPFANTACDAAFPEGAISVRVTDATAVAGPHTFTYAWDNLNNPTAINTLSPGANDGDADGSDGDEDHPTALADGSYTVTIINNQSMCAGTAYTTIFRNGSFGILPHAVATPQVICLPDGSLEVDAVFMTDIGGNTVNAPIGDFEFIWSRTTTTNMILTTQGALGAVPGGTIVDASVYPQAGTDTYFVTARRIAGTDARGCESIPVMVELPDGRLFPELSFTTEANSSCSDANPNGSVAVSAAETSGVNTGPYTFAWTLAGGALSPVTTQTDNNNSSALANAMDGLYAVTVTNTVTGCPVVRDVEVLLNQAASTPNIIDVTTVDPLDCNPTGSAEVTKITLGTSNNSVLYPPQVPPDNEITGAGLNNFNYEWYAGSVAAANQLPVGGPFTTTPAIGSLVAGTYFVIVHDPSTDCKSTMKEVIISDDNIVYPVLNITLLAKQVSCIEGSGSASLGATADGQTDADPNYSFTWFANADQTPPPLATNSTIAGLAAGDYSVTVVNQTTGCSASDYYLIPDERDDYAPIISMGSQPRTLCAGTDGAIVARVTNMMPGYPYPYNTSTYTADLYVGADPDLTAAPDMPSIPLFSGVASYQQTGLNEGIYTVRILDNNTGCFATATEEIRDERRLPPIDLVEVSPVTNCDPARPNGVARVTSDGTFAGFTFEWYEGPAASGVPVYSGPEYSALKVAPQQYTIRVTEVSSGCFNDTTASVQNGALPIPAPQVEVLSHVTSCLDPNGVIGAYVGSDKNTRDYVFDWYDGTVENPPADFTGELYGGIPAGMYSVTATSRITGCKSPLVSGEVLLQQETPQFDFVVQNATCDRDDGYASLVLTSNVPIATIQWENAQGPFLTGPNFTNATAGEYKVTVTSVHGCPATKIVQIISDIRPHNGISRNSDGQNEFFEIDCIQHFENNLVRIYNRAGTLVYEAVGYDNSSTFFDGTSNRGLSPMGVNLPDGTYYYIVDKRDGSRPIAGYLEIVK